MKCARGSQWLPPTPIAGQMSAIPSWRASGRRTGSRSRQLTSGSVATTASNPPSWGLCNFYCNGLGVLSSLSSLLHGATTRRSAAPRSETLRSTADNGHSRLSDNSFCTQTQEVPGATVLDMWTCLRACVLGNIWSYSSRMICWIGSQVTPHQDLGKSRISCFTTSRETELTKN